MAGPVLGVKGAMQLLTRQANLEVQRRADQLRDIVVDLHMNAPRGGVNLNRFGQPRSAPGEQPATETMQLLRRLEMPPTPVNGGYDVMVNYALLESGTVKMQPRPMGMMAVDELKREAKNG